MDDICKKWIHQEEAISIFLEKKHGILEMATGSGKTYTAIQIMKKLLEVKKVERIIIIIYGNDLLYQWYYSLLNEMHNIKIFRQFDKYREINKFVLVKGQSILLLTRDADRIRECLIELEKRRDSDETKKNTMLIFDEIHGLGSPKLRDTLKGYLQGYTYRLGLSATPERDYDEEGNIFIKDEIGDVIYKFDLEEASGIPQHIALFMENIKCRDTYKKLEELKSLDISLEENKKIIQEAYKAFVEDYFSDMATDNLKHQLQVILIQGTI